MEANTLPQDTGYRHHNQIVRWSDRFVCFTDCSGLIDALLKHAYGFSDSTLHSWLGGRGRPLAKNYFAAIMERRGFERIENAAAIQPGDFIAIKYQPWAPDKGEDTGHIMVVNQAPQEINAGQYAVPIIDCSRRRGRHPGIGTGTIDLYTDENGLIYGYSFGLNAKEYGPDKRPLVVGRLIKR